MRRIDQKHWSEVSQNLVLPNVTSSNCSTALYIAAEKTIGSPHLVMYLITGEVSSPQERWKYILCVLLTKKWSHLLVILDIICFQCTPIQRAMHCHWLSLVICQLSIFSCHTLTLSVWYPYCRWSEGNVRASLPRHAIYQHGRSSQRVIWFSALKNVAHTLYGLYSRSSYSGRSSIQRTRIR